VVGTRRSVWTVASEQPEHSNLQALTRDDDSVRDRVECGLAKGTSLKETADDMSVIY
jgi:hypothetical protein